MAIYKKFDPLKEKIAEIAVRAADLISSDGLDPSVAVSKFASEIPSDNFLDRVVEETNQELCKRAFETQQDKRAEYDMADAGEVKAIIKAGVAHGPQKVASVWSRDLDHGTELEKFASPYSRTDEDGYTVDSTGFPMGNELEIRPSTEMVKHAAASAYLQAKEASELIMQEEYEKLADLRSMVHELKGFFKSASARGEDLGLAALGLVYCMPIEKRANASAMVDQAMTDLLAENNIKVAAYQDYMEKTSDIDLTEGGYVMHRGPEQIVYRLHTCLGYMDDNNGEVRAAGDGHKFLGLIDDQISYEIKSVKKVDGSSPALVRGKFF